jgi:hypothetical protein
VVLTVGGAILVVHVEDTARRPRRRHAATWADSIGRESGRRPRRRSPAWRQIDSLHDVVSNQAQTEG